MKKDRRKSTEAATLTKKCAGDAVAAAISKKAPQAVVIKDFKPSEVRDTHRPRLAAVEQNRPDQGLVNATLGLERYLSSGLQCRFQAGKGTAHKTNTSADFVLRLTSCREGRAQVFEGLNLLQGHATEVDGVLGPGA